MHQTPVLDETVKQNKQPCDRILQPLAVATSESLFDDNFVVARS